jgi:GTP-binding protein
MITRCLVENPALKMVVFILDARRIPSEGDKVFIKWLEAHRISYILVVTKSDKLSRGALLNNLRLIKATLQAPEGVEMVPYSVRTALGRERLLEVLGRAVEGGG